MKLTDITDIFSKVNEVQDEDREHSCKKTAGHLRGAMAGAYTSEGVLSAKCSRLDQARVLGVERRITADERVMFSAGFGHEIYLENIFKRMSEIDSEFSFVREKQISSTVHGLPWTGTPDFMITHKGETLGVEAKSLVSNFSVHKQKAANWPFRRHILQAIHYMTILNHDRWLLVLGHYFYALADGKQHPPSIRFYMVTREESGEHVVTNEQGERLETKITREHVLNYLKTIVVGNAEKKLTPKPKWVEFGMKSYNECSYCPMQDACNLYDSDKMTFDTWMQNLKNSKKKGK